MDQRSGADNVPRQLDLSRNASVTISFRLPRDDARRLKESAITAGRDPSEYIRDALLDAVCITAASAKSLQGVAAETERTIAQTEINELRTALAEARAEVAALEDRATGLERELVVYPIRPLLLILRLLGGSAQGRQEFAENWGQLDAADRAAIAPAMVQILRVHVLGIGESTPVLRDRRRLVGHVEWIIGLLDALPSQAPHVQAALDPSIVLRAPIASADPAEVAASIAAAPSAGIDAPAKAPEVPLATSATSPPDVLQTRPQGAPGPAREPDGLDARIMGSELDARLSFISMPYTFFGSPPQPGTAKDLLDRSRRLSASPSGDARTSAMPMRALPRPQNSVEPEARPTPATSTHGDETPSDAPD